MFVFWFCKNNIYYICCRGPSANRIWSKIYSELCFTPEKVLFTFFSVFNVLYFILLIIILSLHSPMITITVCIVHNIYRDRVFLNSVIFEKLISQPFKKSFDLTNLSSLTKIREKKHANLQFHIFCHIIFSPKIIFSGGTDQK